MKRNNRRQTSKMKAAQSKAVRSKKQTRSNTNPHRGRKVMRAVGSAIGGYLGGSAGALIGDSAAEMFSRLTGIGDYKVNQNSILKPNQAPHFQELPGGGIRVRHSEYVRDILAGTEVGAFDYINLRLTPSDPGSFPWLSNIANNYEEFRFHGCVLMYKAMSGTAVGSTNTTLGSVIVATQYDVNRPPFRSKREMEASQYAVSTVPCDNLLAPIECDPKLDPVKQYFCNPSGKISDTDRRMHEKAVVTVATVGCQGSGVNLGELWVTYDVEFHIPCSSDLFPNQARFYSTGVVTGECFNTALVGSDPCSRNPTEIIDATTVRLNTPGYYRLAVNFRSTSASITALANFSSGTGMRLIERNYFFDTTNNYQLNAFNGTNASAAAVFYLDGEGNSDQSGEVNLATFTCASTCSSMLTVTRIPLWDAVEDIILAPLTTLSEKKALPDDKKQRTLYTEEVDSEGNITFVPSSSQTSQYYDPRRGSDLRQDQWVSCRSGSTTPRIRDL